VGNTGQKRAVLLTLLPRPTSGHCRSAR
jgi:hypothetical protein